MKRTKSKLAGIQITQNQIQVQAIDNVLTLFEPALERELSQIHESRQEDVRQYLALQFANGLKRWTVFGSMNAILTLEIVGKDYKNMTNDDLSHGRR